ncbi:hypothetical protein EniLVp02_0226 [Vibrio phage EniLVp02]
MPDLVIKTFSLYGVDYKSVPDNGNACDGCVLRSDERCDVLPRLFCKGFIHLPVNPETKPDDDQETPMCERDYAIGETFELKGNTYRVEPETDDKHGSRSCKDCDAQPICFQSPECQSESRADRTDVIFIRVEGSNDVG